MIDEMLLNKILTQAAYENSIERVSYSTGLSVDEICKTLIESKIYHLFPASIMRYLNNNGVSLFDLVAKYGFELHVLAKEFFQHGPEYYHGKTVNYLKIVSHIREKDAVYFVCECLVCGNPEFKIKKYNAINGLTKSCGCLPKGKRIPNEFPIKNETLQPELKALTSELLDKGVLFNNEAKIINKIRKGETSAEKIAIEFNCDMNYVYKVARKHGYAEKVNRYSADNLHKANKEKVRKMLPAIKHGNSKILCREFNISQDTFRKYRKIIQDEARSDGGI